MSASDPVSWPVDVAGFAYVVGLDVGSQQLLYPVCQPDKRAVIKPTEVTNDRAGFARLDAALRQLGVPPERLLIGLDATTIARLLLSREARAGYGPDELIATYRELERLHPQLTEEGARYRNEIQALVVVQFPEFTQVKALPCGATALALLERYPSAAAFVAAGVQAIAATLHELAPRRYGRRQAEQLVRLARQSASSGRVAAARALSLKVLCDQLAHPQANLEKVDEQLDQLLDRDAGAQRLQSVPEFGPQTTAVLRAELGDVSRFQRVDQAVAYVGLDLEVRQSGKWKGEVKLSKRGSGRGRCVLYLAAMRSISLKDSAFGAYYQRLLARGLKACDALMAVMRKMLIVASHVLRSNETYDPAKVCAVACTPPRTPSLGS